MFNQSHRCLCFTTCSVLIAYLSIYLGNIDLNLYTYIYIDFFMYIYTVKYSSRNTHEPGERDERSLGVKRTRIYTATIHYITTRYATGASAQYSDASFLRSENP